MSELRQPLYRKLRPAVICWALISALALAVLAPAVLAQDALAQTPRPKRKVRALRALAVLELASDSQAPGRGKLVPIYVLDDGKYYDAGLYRVRPRPLAVESGTIYEAERSGEPAGLFTVEQAAERERAWFAVGGWAPRKLEPDKPAELSLPVTVKTPDDDAPPVLRKPKPGGGASPGASAPEQKAGASQAGATPAVPPEEPDPDRPVLRRGKPKAAEKDPAAALEEFTKPASSAGAKEPERLVAVSDASPQERRPYGFPWTRDEQERLTGEITAMAQAELAKALAKTLAKSGPTPAPKRATQGARARKSTPAVLPALEDARVRVFDLNFDNNVEIVLTARHTAPAGATTPERKHYVTVVAAVAIGGELRRLLTSVTDEQRLDSVPRLELIDAVDAEGNGDGELLFRRVGRTRQSYELFRVGIDKLWTLFEGAASPL